MSNKLHVHAYTFIPPPPFPNKKKERKKIAHNVSKKKYMTVHRNTNSHVHMPCTLYMYLTCMYMFINLFLLYFEINDTPNSHAPECYAIFGEKG